MQKDCGTHAICHGALHSSAFRCLSAAEMPLKDWTFAHAPGGGRGQHTHTHTHTSRWMHMYNKNVPPYDEGAAHCPSLVTAQPRHSQGVLHQRVHSTSGVKKSRAVWAFCCPPSLAKPISFQKVLSKPWGNTAFEYPWLRAPHTPLCDLLACCKTYQAGTSQV